MVDFTKRIHIETGLKKDCCIIFLVLERGGQHCQVEKNRAASNDKYATWNGREERPLEKESLSSFVE